MNVIEAWRRVKYDLAEKSFIAPVFLTEIIQSKLNDWLRDLENQFTKSYQVGLNEVVDVPKGNGLVRPGALLKIEDNIYYNSLVQECYLDIARKVEWSQGKIDFGYIISEKAFSNIPFFSNHLEGWSNFREASLTLLENHEYIVLTDITGCYENINIGTLISDLKSINVSSEVVNKLSSCLNTWATDGRGLPQGNSSSDVLAKLYLNFVDEGLSNAGYTHLRYVDDFRIFCYDEIEAKKALMKLTHLLRKRGLTVQSAKTKIVRSADARKEISAVKEIISEIAKKIEEEKLRRIEELAFYDQDSMSTDEEDAPPLDTIRSIFSEYFIKGDSATFNKSLFHYLLNRLIKEKDSFAVNYCLSILTSHPEETNYILKSSLSFHPYDSIVMNDDKKMHERLILFLRSKDAIYEFQNYQILKWLSNNVHYYNKQLLLLCRQLSFDNNRPYFIRSIARMILGRIGNSADIESIADCITNSATEIEKAELICCLTRMEKTKKRGLLSRIEHESKIISLAVTYAKGLDATQAAQKNVQ